jgi:hypothetical protein
MQGLGGALPRALGATVIALGRAHRGVTRELLCDADVSAGVEQIPDEGPPLYADIGITQGFSRVRSAVRASTGMGR